MAGDWIKMRTDLYRDPKVSVIADSLMSSEGDLALHVSQMCQRDMTVTRNVMRNVTVGALVSVWGVMRQRGKRDETDLVCTGVTLFVIDDISDLPGFGAAMAEAGWVVADGNRLVFPRFFDEYNVDPEDRTRASNRERQRRYRERHKDESNGEDNVTRNVTVTPRVEKSREEKKEQKQKQKTAPDGELFDGVDPVVAADFKAMRAKMRAPVTKTAMAGIRREAAAAGITVQEALAMCCERGWRGFKADWLKDRPINGASATGYVPIAGEV